MLKPVVKVEVEVAGRRCGCAGCQWEWPLHAAPDSPGTLGGGRERGAEAVVCGIHHPA